MSKTGCSQPNYLNPRDPVYAYHGFEECSCGKKHIFRVPYKEMPTFDVILEYPCKNTQNKIIKRELLVSAWDTRNIDKNEKEYLVDITILSQVSDDTIS